MSTIAGSLVCLVRLAGVKSAGPIGISLLMALLATLAVGKDSYSDARSTFAACVSGIALALSFILAFTIFKGWKLLASLDKKPWKLVAEKQGDLSMRSCPFSEHTAEWACRSCGTRVADIGWHKQEKRVDLLSCDAPMDWSLITIALSNSTDPQKGRRDCDAGLLFRGNVLTCSMSEACIGCYTRVLCGSLIPRLCIAAHCVSGLLALLPYSVPDYIDTLSSGVHSGLLNLAASLSILFGVTGTALLMLTIGVLTTFITTHCNIPWKYQVPSRGRSGLLLRACTRMLAIRYQAKIQVMPEESIRAMSRAHTAARESGFGSRRSTPRVMHSSQESIDLPASVTGRRMVL